MRDALEAHAEVIHVVGPPPMHAAPRLVEGVAAVTYVEHGVLAHLKGHIEVDGEQVVFLLIAGHIDHVAGHVGDSQVFEFQHQHIGSFRGLEVDESLALQGVVTEVEIPQMNLVMGHVEMLAHSLGLGVSQQGDNANDK